MGGKQSCTFLKTADVKSSTEVPSTPTNTPQTDTVVNTVIEQFSKRSNLGIKKYGTTLDREDLKTMDWVQHLQEELMDAILYLERLKRDLEKGTKKDADADDPSANKKEVSHDLVLGPIDDFTTLEKNEANIF
jgi:hypothetical protein